MISVNMKKCTSYIRKHWLFLLDLSVILLFYAAFLITKHYDCDSFSLLMNGNQDGAITNLQMGRIPTWLLYQALDLIGFSAPRHSRLGLALVILSCAYSVSHLSGRLGGFMKPGDRMTLLGINAALLLTVLNASFHEGWIYFSECSYDRAISVALIFSALSVWMREGKTWKDYLLSFLLLSLAIDMYQLYIELFLSFALLWLLLEHHLHWSRRAFKDLLITLAVGLSASAQNILLMRWLSASGFIPANPRSASVHLSVILENLRQIWTSQPAVWKNFQGTMFPWVLPAFFLIMAILFLQAARENRCTGRDIAFAALAMLAGYLSSFAPLLLSGVFWMPPRVIIGFFSFLSCSALLVLFLDSRRAGKAVLLCCTGLIVLSGIKVQAISADNIASNRIDEEYVGEIGNAIRSYEESSGNTIRTISVHFDDSVTWYHASTRYRIMDINVSGFVKSWSDVNMINWYLGTSYARESMSDAQYRRLFGSSDWSVFDPSEQLIFQGSTLYLAVY